MQNPQPPAGLSGRAAGSPGPRVSHPPRCSHSANSCPGSALPGVGTPSQGGRRSGGVCLSLPSAASNAVSFSSLFPKALVQGSTGLAAPGERTQAGREGWVCRKDRGPVRSPGCHPPGSVNLRNEMSAESRGPAASKQTLCMNYRARCVRPTRRQGWPADRPASGQRLMAASASFLLSQGQGLGMPGSSPHTASRPVRQTSATKVEGPEQEKAWAFWGVSTSWGKSSRPLSTLQGEKQDPGPTGKPWYFLSNEK